MGFCSVSVFYGFVFLNYYSLVEVVSKIFLLEVVFEHEVDEGG